MQHGDESPTITSSFPPAGQMGANDVHPPGVLKACDDFFRAVQQQQWADAQMQQLADRLRTVDWARINYGHGWRVWYPDGTVVDSRTCTWADLGHGFIGGVAYNIGTRWMFQGRDPFYLEEDGLPRDVRDAPPPACIDPGAFRYGVWVTDEAMREFRFNAVMALTLEDEC